MLIALSGGADSVALLLLMLERGENVQAAAHCNFSLRGAESDRDEAFVSALCEKTGVPLFVRRFDTRAEAARTGESVEMAARRLRYAWFEALCKEKGFDRVAVAHHQDDNAETLLLNLARGTGLRGLTGMRADGVKVLRPLLGYTRKEILDYLARRGQDYMTDSTNADTRYKRNLIRHEALPLLARLNPSIVRSLNETARRLREAEEIYDYGLSLLRERLCVPYRGDGLSIRLAELAESPAPATLLHEWLAPYGFGRRQCEEALEMRNGGFTEAGGNLCTRNRDRLMVAARPVTLDDTPLPAAKPENQVLRLAAQGMELEIRLLARAEMKEIPRTPQHAALNAAALRGTLKIRSVRKGDRFVPFGMRGVQLVSDYLTARHCSRIDKLAALAVTDDEGIVWLAGERPAARCAVTDDTREVALLTLRTI